MSKTTAQYWNVLASSSAGKWEPVAGSSGMLEQLTLAMDEETGDYTRLTRFKRGWASGTKTTYLCGHVQDPDMFSRLCGAVEGNAAEYFPAYRAGEFA